MCVGRYDVLPAARAEECRGGGWANISRVRGIDAERLRGGLLSASNTNTNYESRITNLEKFLIRTLYFVTRHSICITFRGRIMMETVLLLEGLNDSCGCTTPATYKPLTGTKERGVKKMAALKRITIPGRGVRCQQGGRFVKCPTRISHTRSRSRSKRRSLLGGLGQVTDARGLMAQFQPQLVNGGLAAAGAWLSQSLGGKVAKMVNVTTTSTTGNLLTLAVGVLLAGIVGKVTKKPQIGVALGTGAVAITILNLIGTMMPKTAGFGVLQAEAAPYYQRSMAPPLYPMQALSAAGASVPNLYSDIGVAAIV